MPSTGDLEANASEYRLRAQERSLLSVLHSERSKLCDPIRDGNGVIWMAGADTKIEQAGSSDTGVCDCCGRSSRCVWGYAHTHDRCIAAYFVHWTLGHIPDRGANIDIILGEWGEAATADRRNAIGLAYRLTETGPSMMVVDAETRPFSRNSLVGRALRRNEVIGTPVAQEAFAVADAILSKDERVAELLGGWKVSA